ncbi:hypothetical protein P1P75_02175 [Streptomyces sp. ID05-39B]|nr:hypothetical protein [Streptomyces sp. ID05-39B]MDX3525269.1 hypothetical protein [Streptomyces sp. ID05-39B]
MAPPEPASQRCAAGEYGAGIAFTTRLGGAPAPAALLCVPLPP